ncbi:3-dehydroquinate synthase [Candidatus Vidania fulgoroideorum]
MKNFNIFFCKDFKSLFFFLKNVKKNKIFIVDYFFKNIRLKKKIIKGEKDKNFNIIKNIIDFMIKKKYNNNTVILSLGGGCVGDISCFISSIFNRGISYINVPSTLLSQVDSSIGGKNGVNTKNAKNMIGTIYLPKYVFIFYNLLKTLNRKHIIDGFAEIIKISLINNKKLFLYIKKNNFSFKKIIYYSIKSKISIIKNNINDNNKRYLLNFGHTFGHSIEKIYNYNLSHGKSIYLGIIISSFLSNYLGFLKKKKFFLIINLIKKYFKNFLYYFKKINIKILLKNIKFDKKNKNNFVNLVLLKDIGNTFIFKFKIKFLKKILNLKKIVKRIS